MLSNQFLKRVTSWSEAISLIDILDSIFLNMMSNEFLKIVTLWSEAISLIDISDIECF